MKMSGSASAGTEWQSIMARQMAFHSGLTSTTLAPGHPIRDVFNSHINAGTFPSPLPPVRSAPPSTPAPPPSAGGSGSGGGSSGGSSSGNTPLASYYPIPPSLSARGYSAPLDVPFTGTNANSNSLNSHLLAAATVVRRGTAEPLPLPATNAITTVSGTPTAPAIVATGSTPSIFHSRGGATDFASHSGPMPHSMPFALIAPISGAATNGVPITTARAGGMFGGFAAVLDPNAAAAAAANGNKKRSHAAVAGGDSGSSSSGDDDTAASAGGGARSTPASGGGSASGSGTTKKAKKVRPSKKYDANGNLLPRIKVSCIPCSKLKVRCDGNQPCSRCTKKGIETSCVRREHLKPGPVPKRKPVPHPQQPPQPLPQPTRVAGSASGAAPASIATTRTKRAARKPAHRQSDDEDDDGGGDDDSGAGGGEDEDSDGSGEASVDARTKTDGPTVAAAASAAGLATSIPVKAHSQKPGLPPFPPAFAFLHPHHQTPLTNPIVPPNAAAAAMAPPVLATASAPSTVSVGVWTPNQLLAPLSPAPASPSTLLTLASPGKPDPAVLTSALPTVPPALLASFMHTSRAAATAAVAAHAVTGSGVVLTPGGTVALPPSPELTIPLSPGLTVEQLLSFTSHTSSAAAGAGAGAGSSPDSPYIDVCTSSASSGSGSGSSTLTVPRSPVASLVTGDITNPPRPALSPAAVEVLCSSPGPHSGRSSECVHAASPHSGLAIEQHTLRIGSRIVDAIHSTAPPVAAVTGAAPAVPAITVLPSAPAAPSAAALASVDDSKTSPNSDSAPVSPSRAVTTTSRSPKATASDARARPPRSNSPPLRRHVPDSMTSCLINEPAECGTVRKLAASIGSSFIASFFLTIDDWFARMLSPQQHENIVRQRAAFVPAAVLSKMMLAPRIHVKWIPDHPSGSSGSGGVGGTNDSVWGSLPMAVVRHEFIDRNKMLHFAALQASLERQPPPQVRVSVNKAATDLFGYTTESYIALYGNAPASFKLLHPNDYRPQMEWELRTLGLFKKWADHEDGEQRKKRLKESAAATAAAAAAAAATPPVAPTTDSMSLKLDANSIPPFECEHPPHLYSHPPPPPAVVPSQAAGGIYVPPATTPNATSFLANGAVAELARRESVAGGNSLDSDEKARFVVPPAKEPNTGSVMVNAASDEIHRRSAGASTTAAAIPYCGVAEHQTSLKGGPHDSHDPHETPTVLAGTVDPEIAFADVRNEARALVFRRFVRPLIVA